MRLAEDLERYAQRGYSKYLDDHNHRQQQQRQQQQQQQQEGEREREKESRTGGRLESGTVSTLEETCGRFQKRLRPKPASGGRLRPLAWRAVRQGSPAAPFLGGPLRRVF